MRRMVYTQPIERPPEVVWRFLADPANDTRWRREICTVELVSGEPGATGALYRETIRWGGMNAAAELTVVESQPGRRLVLQADGAGYRSTSSWTIEPGADGGSLVTLAFSFEMTGAAHLAEPMTWGIVSGWLERDLPLLEGHLRAA